MTLPYLPLDEFDSLSTDEQAVVEALSSAAMDILAKVRQTRITTVTVEYLVQAAVIFTETTGPFYEGFNSENLYFGPTGHEGLVAMASKMLGMLGDNPEFVKGLRAFFTVGYGLPDNVLDDTVRFHESPGVMGIIYDNRAMYVVRFERSVAMTDCLAALGVESPIDKYNALRRMATYYGGAMH